MLLFLQKHGFFRIRLENNYQFVRIEDNIIEIVNELTMKDFILDHIRNLKDANGEEDPWRETVEEAIIRGAKNYFSKSILESLEYKEISIRRDDKESCYLYFKDKWVKITKDEITLNEYKKLDGQIWKSQLIDRGITYKENIEDSEYYKFIALAVCGKTLPTLDENQKESEIPAEIRKLNITKILSAHTAIGYLLHGFKDPSKAKAVVAVDSKIGKPGDMNGGSGKSLVGKALRHLIKEAYIEAQNFKFDYPFAFDAVNLDTRFVNFNDAGARFEFNRAFGYITEDFPVNKKHIGSFTIPFDQSPKLFISTNHTLRGDGTSFRRRQFVVEFSDYFNSENTPDKEFGHLLFSDWRNELEDQWNLFYSFMIHCIKTYLERGLISVDSGNYQLRKLLSYVSEDFYQHCEALQLNKEYVKKELYTEFKTAYAPDFDQLKLNTFSKYLHAYCEYKGYMINPTKQNEKDRGRDNRNGVDYITIVDKKDLKHK
jgi:hypothetical protein